MGPSYSLPAQPGKGPFWTPIGGNYSAPIDRPEVNGRPITATLGRAAALLADGDEIAAQEVLDRAGFERLSPEGAILMEAVGERLGVLTPGMPVLARNPLWQKRDIALFAPMFDQFADTAAWFEKSSGLGWDPTKHPRLGTSPNPGWFATTADNEEPSPSRNAQPPRIKLPNRPGNLPTEPPPRLPDRPPPTNKGKNEVAKSVARWLAKVGGVVYDVGGKVLSPRLRLVLKAFHAAVWLYDNPEFGGLSPRRYLRDKDWATRYRIGLRALREAGVLKP